MKQSLNTKYNKILRKNRVRAKVHGTAQRPRLSVHISHLNVSVQIIDDDKGKTLASSTTVGKKISGTLTEKSVIIGTEIAEIAKKAKITKIVFDRNGRLYHGRVKALAEAARQGGLEF